MWAACHSQCPQEHTSAVNGRYSSHCESLDEPGNRGCGDRKDIRTVTDALNSKEDHAMCQGTPQFPALLALMGEMEKAGKREPMYVGSLGFGSRSDSGNRQEAVRERSSLKSSTVVLSSESSV